MLGIGLPEMIVILALALIVVGPDKLPDMARSVAKWVFELKKTVNQVKESLADEENLIGSVQSDLRETGEELKEKLLESDHFTWHEGGGPKNADNDEQEGVNDIDNSLDGQSIPEDEFSKDNASEDSDIPDPESKSNT